VKGEAKCVRARHKEWGGDGMENIRPTALTLFLFFISPSSETLDKCLARIARNALPADRKSGGKKKKGEVTPPVLPPPSGTPALFPGGAGATPLPADTPNGVAWATAVRLEVGGVSYAVVLNPPTVVKVCEGRPGGGTTETREREKEKAASPVLP